MRLFHLPLFAALAGCATLAAPPPAPGQAPLPTAGQAQIRLLLQKSESDLRRLTLDLADPAAEPAFAEVSAGLAGVQVAVLTQALIQGPESGLQVQAEQAAMGATLALCAQGVQRLQGTERAQAAHLARGSFTLTCLVPLAVFAAR